MNILRETRKHIAPVKQEHKAISKQKFREYEQLENFDL